MMRRMLLFQHVKSPTETGWGALGLSARRSSLPRHSEASRFPRLFAVHVCCSKILSPWLAQDQSGSEWPAAAEARQDGASLICDFPDDLAGWLGAADQTHALASP